MSSNCTPPTGDQQKPASHTGTGDDVPRASWIAPGTADYRRSGLALFLVGFATFSLIYCVQPLLPVFAEAFARTPAQSSLALSVTTGSLAVSIVLAGAFSQALGRRGLMFVSMMLAGICNIATGIAPSWSLVLIARCLEGFVLGGVPAVAMAWLAEEIDPRHLGKSMGLYVAGTAFGGMTGRVGMGLVTEYASWRYAMVGLGVICLITAIGFLSLLPTSKNFVHRPGLNLRYHIAAWGHSLRNAGLLRLYAFGFVLMSIFVVMFNYATFRLSAAPYNLGPTAVSLIFLVYSFGIVSSSVSGNLADRFGQRPLMIAGFLFMLCGVLLTLSANLPVIVIGISVVTAGMFIGYSVASGSIGPLARATKGHASALYLLFYYVGSSVTGTIGGWFWLHGGWSSIVALTAGLAVMGLILAATNSRPANGA